MALADFLGDLGSVFGSPMGQPPAGALGQLPAGLPGIISGFGGGTWNADGSQATPVDQGDQLGQMPFEMAMMERQAPMQQQKRPGGGLLSFLGNSGTRDTLGQIGDYLLQANDMAPIYAPQKARRDQQQVGEQLAQYLGTGDEALANIIRTDPQTGMALLKMKRDQQKANDPTALMQNMEYLRRLNPTLTDAQLAEVAQYAIAAPRMYGSPETGFSPDPNYPFIRGEQAPQQGGVSEGQTATNPQTGEKIIFQNGAWVPAGGVSGNAGSGFP